MEYIKMFTGYRMVGKIAITAPNESLGEKNNKGLKQ